MRAMIFNGAGDGTRTRGCKLGKLVPYHLATPALKRIIRYLPYVLCTYLIKIHPPILLSLSN